MSLGERSGRLDRRKAVVNDGAIPAVMGMEKSSQARWPGVLDLRECRPASKKIAVQDGVVLRKPVEDLWVILLERIGQTIGETRLVAHQLAAVLGQTEENAHAFALHLKRGEALRVADQQIQGEFGIGRIVLGAAGLEGFAIFGQG